MCKRRACIGDNFLNPLAFYQVYPEIEVPGVSVVCNSICLNSIVNPLEFSKHYLDSKIMLKHFWQSGMNLQLLCMKSLPSKGSCEWDLNFVVINGNGFKQTSIK